MKFTKRCTSNYITNKLDSLLQKISYFTYFSKKLDLFQNFDITILPEQINEAEVSVFKSKSSFFCFHKIAVDLAKDKQNTKW